MDFYGIMVIVTVVLIIIGVVLIAVVPGPRRKIERPGRATSLPNRFLESAERAPFITSYASSVYRFDGQDESYDPYMTAAESLLQADKEHHRIPMLRFGRPK
jgi:hypothetical protein